ncbi:hypothetical protein ANCDUO_20195, partial [Ancylostoma duodenale]
MSFEDKIATFPHAPVYKTNLFKLSPFVPKEHGVPMWHSGLNMVLTILTYISSTTNPVTYCFMNKGFRASVLSYCTRKKRPTSCSAPNSRKSPTKDGAKDTANTIPMIK